MVGYDGKSKSINATLAELQNKYPAYKAANILNVPIKAIFEILSPCEWHHTSPCYNKTNYYYIGIILKLQQGISVETMIDLGYDESEVYDNHSKYLLLKNYKKG